MLYEDTLELAHFEKKKKDLSRVMESVFKCMKAYHRWQIIIFH